jgi:hypothetical protein
VCPQDYSFKILQDSPNNSVGFDPYYYLHERAEWLVFPHELDGLKMTEIAAGKKDLANILDLFE